MIETEKLAFLHIPKTGGTFVRKALNDCGLITYRPADVHEIRPTLKPTFAFVRHPIDWLVSYFHHQRFKHKWELKRELDRICRCDNLNGFLRNVANHSGVVKRTFDHWLRHAQMIGRTESLSTDLIRILDWAGEDFDADTIRRLEPQNTQEYREGAADELIDQIYQSEFPLYISFGYDKTPPA